MLTLGIVSFIDLNAEAHLFQRRFTSEILRCDAVDSQLNSIMSQLTKREIAVLELPQRDLPCPKYRDLHGLEQLVASLSSELASLEKNMDSIRQTYVRTLENYGVLRKMNDLWAAIDLGDLTPEGEPGQVVSTVGGDQQQLQITSLTGLIAAEKMLPLERMLWRFFGRNIYVKVITLEEPIESLDFADDYAYRKVFTIYYKGERHIAAKLRKICDAFRAQIFELASTPAEREAAMGRLERAIADQRTVLAKSKDYYFKVLRNCAVEVVKWRTQTVKFRSIFVALNKFNYDLARKCLIGELWCPAGDRPLLQHLLNRFNQANDYLAPTILDVLPPGQVHQVVPTYFRLNKFTQGFQNIVDSYGVADYQEANPAPYTIITFPFLFAIMFGDAGHGLILALFGAWMVITEQALIARKIKDEIWQMFFTGRYIILLMGLFSIYSGLMYNDVFSKSLNVFGSSFGPYKPVMNNHSQPQFLDLNRELKPNETYTGSPYPFGIDPIWEMAGNRIVYLNTYKMKLSVILGVSQMAFGVMLSLLNHLHFRRYLNIFCEFIPQMIFLLSIFGYMNLMIFVKWFKYDYTTNGDAPSILINLINMFLMKYPTDGMRYLQPWYPGQQAVQTTLLISALLCVPWILVPKVLIERSRAKKLRNAQGGRASYEHFENEHEEEEEESQQGGQLGPSDGSSGSGGHGASHHEESFFDAFIHQAIHTIEFCLGSVSHTASYLRLWALSLAHSELSEVLWTMVLQKGLKAGSSVPYLNGLLMFTAFAFWAVLSVAVLIVMEGLSAFLHALRLHWVEFQSKFYTGSGVKFEPYSFEAALTEAGLD